MMLAVTAGLEMKEAMTTASPSHHIDVLILHSCLTSDALLVDSRGPQTGFMRMLDTCIFCTRNNGCNVLVDNSPAAAAAVLQLAQQTLVLLSLALNQQLKPF